MTRRVLIPVGIFASLSALPALLNPVQTSSLAQQSVQSPGQGSAPSQPFEEANIYLEFNSTDEDMGVHIDTDHDEGIKELVVVAPRGRVIIEQDWVTRPPLGLTEMFTESAEPDLESALRSYGPGTYRFFGRTVTGKRLYSTAVLSHELLDPPSIAYPPEGGTGIPTSGTVASWAPVEDAEGYMVELSGPDGTILESVLGASATTFEIPDGLLQPNTEYTFGVAARGENMNLSLASVAFTTGS